MIPDPVVFTAPPDYSTTIRAEIEADVRKLISRVRNWSPHDGWVMGTINPLRIDLGYLINTHHGHDLYKDGDLICGVPVEINRLDIRTIGVDGGMVACEIEDEIHDEESGRYRIVERCWDEYVYESITW